MENVTSFLKTTAYIVIFCLAGFGLLYQYRTLNKVITTTKEAVSSENILYEQYIDEIQETNVSYADMVTTLFGDFDYDIQINGLLISKVDFNYHDFDFSNIPKRNYKKSYIYDSSGNIKKVNYEIYQG
jgi:hypothetical protein